MANPFSPEFLETLAQNEAKGQSPVKEQPKDKENPKNEAPADATPTQGGMKDGVHEIKDSAGNVVQKIPFSQGKCTAPWRF